VLKVLGRIFVTIGKGVAAVFRNAEQRGLTDELVEKAEGLVAEAQTVFDNNTMRREWAVVALTTAGVPESLARLAIELGVQSYKAAQAAKPAQ
jgi:hypothetical protein